MRFAFLAAVALAVAAPAFAQSSVRTVSSEAFSPDRGGAILIDVRQPAEWAETGLPQGAKPISVSREDFLAAVLSEVGGDRSKPVAVICKSGGRSIRAAEQLAAAGFTDVTNIGDGMMGRRGVGEGWLAAGLPTLAYKLDE